MMTEFPNSSAEIRKLALQLVKHLRDGIKNTRGRAEWSCQNFCLLREFTELLQIDCFPSDDDKNPLFLWDFMGYLAYHGPLIVAESEWFLDPHEIEHDFEKLLYVRSPLKLFLCRIDARIETEGEAMAEAARICSSFRHLMETTCTYYSPGEVFINYCVWYAGGNRKNRDISYILQIKGEPTYQPLENEQFQEVSD